jgi:hypothetical protein
MTLNECCRLPSGLKKPPSAPTKLPSGTQQRCEPCPSWRLLSSSSRFSRELVAATISSSFGSSDAHTNARDPHFRITVAATLAYAAIVAGFLVVLDID